MKKSSSIVVCLFVLLLMYALAEGTGLLTSQKFYRCPSRPASEAGRLGVMLGRSDAHCLSRCASTEGCVGVTVCPSGDGGKAHCTLVSDYDVRDCEAGTNVTPSPCYIIHKPTTLEQTPFTTAEPTMYESSATAAGTTEPATRVTSEGARTTAPACLNGGTLNGNQCTCPPQYAGTACERAPRDCTEIFQNGYTEAQYRGPYNIQPVSAPAPFQVICDFAWGSGITWPFAREISSVNFNRNWAELSQQAIGNPATDQYNFFVGLDNLHYLLSQGGYELTLKAEKQ